MNESDPMSKQNDKKKKSAASSKGTPSAYKTAQTAPPAPALSFRKKGSKAK